MNLIIPILWTIFLNPRFRGNSILFYQYDYTIMSVLTENTPKIIENDRNGQKKYGNKALDDLFKGPR